MQYKNLKFFLLIFLFFLPLFVFAQATYTYQEEQKKFNDGLELLDFKLYAAAQQSFKEYLSIGTDAEKRIEAEYFMALCALRLGEPDADTRLENFLASHPYHPKALDAYYQWGEVYFEAGDYNKAIEFYEKVPERRLSNARKDDRNYKLALAYFERRRYNQAEMYFNKLKEGTNQYAYAASYYAGFIAYQENRNNVALTDLQRASESEVYAKKTPVLIADIYSKEKKYNELIQFATPILQKNLAVEQLDQLYLLTADAYFNKQEYFRALNYYKQYLGLSATQAADEVYYKLGFSQYQTADYRGTTESLQNVANLNSAMGQSAAYYLGLAYIQENNKRFAVTALEQAKNRKFDVNIEQEAIWLLGKLNFDLERYDESIANLKQFIADYPQHPDRGEALDLLGQAYLYSNKLDEAMTYLESINPRPPKVNAAYQQITFAKGSELFNKSNFGGAIPYFQKSLQVRQISTLTYQTSFWLAESYLLSEKPVDAIPYYQNILSLDQPSFPYTSKSHYGLGYAYYNTEQYARAITHFQYYITRRDVQDDRKYFEDAFVRLADCYYATRDYPNAIRFYDQVIANNYVDIDYAYFQKGVIANLQNNTTLAQASFEALINQFPNSLYRDRAFYQKAIVDMSSGSFAVAITGLTRLISESPKSSIIPDALQLRALAYINIGNQNAAIEDYKKIINEHTRHPVASDALFGLQELLTAQGRESELQPLLAKYRDANPNNQTTEKLYFENAKTQYFNQNYTQSVDAFRQFLNSYPSSTFKGDALFYLGESYFRLNDNRNALTYHRQVVAEKGSTFISRSARRVAGIYAQNKEYRNAVSFYRILSSVTESKREQIDAWIGLVENYYELQRYDSLNYFAGQVLNQPDIAGSKNRAQLYQGKVAYRQQNYPQALTIFQAVAKGTVDENGAEAQYLIADIQYRQQKYRESLETLFELDKRYSSFENWRGRGFLLIADNYIALKENFQAKATLQSLIDKSPDPEIVKEARQKLQSIG